MTQHNYDDKVSDLMNYVRKILHSTLRAQIFEPNDARARHIVASEITHFLERLKNQRELVDFKVVCGEENNPPFAVRNGELFVDVFIAPWYVPAGTIKIIHGSIGKSAAVLEEETMATGASYIAHTYGAQSTQMPALVSLNVENNGDTKLNFTGEEGDQVVLAEFEPERDITTYEYMHIMQLQLLLISSALTGQDPRGMVNPIEIIRRHNLERHFKFSEF